MTRLDIDGLAAELGATAPRNPKPPASRGKKPAKAAPVEEDDEDDEEDEEEDEDDTLEELDEDEEEAPPPPKKGKKGKPAPVEEDEEEDEEEDDTLDEIEELDDAIETPSPVKLGPPSKGKKPEPVEDEEDEEDEEKPAPRRGRGRPKGSKNKPKGEEKPAKAKKPEPVEEDDFSELLDVDEEGEPAPRKPAKPVKVATTEDAERAFGKGSTLGAGLAADLEEREAAALGASILDFVRVVRARGEAKGAVSPEYMEGLFAGLGARLGGIEDAVGTLNQKVEALAARMVDADALEAALDVHCLDAKETGAAVLDAIRAAKGRGN